MASASANPPLEHHVWLVYFSGEADSTSAGSVISAHRSKEGAIGSSTDTLGLRASDYESKVEVLMPGLEKIREQVNTNNPDYRRTCLLQRRLLEVRNPEAGPQTDEEINGVFARADTVYLVCTPRTGGVVRHDIRNFGNEVYAWKSAKGVVDMSLDRHKASNRKREEEAKYAYGTSGLTVSLDLISLCS
ncbi:MAG: hypothetical protein Q9174_004288 [Haloplaca sp. 1 TL-2023]